MRGIDDESKNENAKTKMKNCNAKLKRAVLLVSVLFIPIFAFSAHAQEPKQRGAQASPQGIPVSSNRAAEQRTIEEERLNILKNDIQKEIGEYKKLRKEIDDAQKTLDVKSQEKLMKVAKMFESMAPEDAAKKMEKLDEDTAVNILTTLKPKSAGKILAQMENEKAANISRKILAKGKNPQEKSSP